MTNIPKEEEGVALKVILTPAQVELQFISLFNRLCASTNACAEKAGEWKNVSAGERIAVMHSELSKALDALRSGNHPDTKLEGFSAAESEFADVVICIMDFCKHFNLRLGDALVKKVKYCVKAGSLNA